jgi:hypothetical protein
MVSYLRCGTGHGRRVSDYAVILNAAKDLCD